MADEGTTGGAVGFAPGEIDPTAPTRAARLKWVVVADAATLGAVRARAASSSGTFVAGMPSAAQRTRVYADYVTAMGETAAADVEYAAVSVVGPRNRVDKIVGRLPLMP